MCRVCALNFRHHGLIILRTGSYNLLGIALTTAASTWALEPADLFLIQKGNFALKPQFDNTLTYDDNITYQEDNPDSDFRAIISPGFTLQWGSRTFNYIDFTYFYDRVQYFDATELNANQHRAALVSRIEKSRFLLEGRDEFSQLSSPLGGGISIGGIQVERNTWLDQYRLTYDFSDKTALYGEMLHSTTDYETGVRLYDSMTLMPTLGFEYKAFSRTSFFGEVYYGMTKSDRNADNMPEYPTADFVGGFIGARGNFTEQLTGMVKAGYEYRWYRQDDGDLSAPVVEVSLTERFTDKTALSLTYSRRQRESVQFVRSAYTSDTVSANLTQQIGNDGRFRGDLFATYMSADYEENAASTIGNRHDHLIATGLTLTYDIKLWMRAFGRYDFEYLNSNTPAVVEYTVNRITLGFELGF